MANTTIHKDGFDQYGPPGIINGGPGLLTLTQLLQQEWTQAVGMFGIVAGLSSTGFAIQNNSSSEQSYL